MVILITYIDINPYTLREEILVSHGVDINTLKNVQLPLVKPSEIGYYSEVFGEWILNEDEEQEEKEEE